MITPLMYLLSSIDQNYNYSRPVDISYLSRADRTAIVSEAHRLGKLACDDRVICTVESPSGKIVVDTTQVVNDRAVEISAGTAMLLTRVREAYAVFCQSGMTKVETLEEDADLGTDAVILRIEGNPKYAYVYVYNVMEAKGVDYNTKLLKIAELYSTIIGHSRASGVSDAQQKMIGRLEYQASEDFWAGMLMADWMRSMHEMPQLIGGAELRTIKRELKDLGFYGFVNPHKMYMTFAGARVHRKVEVNISDEIIDYLDKVVRSGGVVD